MTATVTQRAAARQHPLVVSRDTTNALRCDVEGYNLNAWCVVPGTPFARGLKLLPNPPHVGDVAVDFGPLRLPEGIDTLTWLVRCSEQPHDNCLDITFQVLDDSRSELGSTSLTLPSGHESAATVTFGSVKGRGIHLKVRVGFDVFAGSRVFGSVAFRYLLAYRRSELNDLFNAAGSDKGTEKHWGNGTPHCYAVVYEELLAPMRHERFNFLEIGLDTASQHTGTPSGAPSLKAWREYLTAACLYGFDVNDFSFLVQAGTSTFQGDQGSRDDIRRFLEEHGNPRFRVVIDDGSHAPADQQVSLASLFPALEPGGLYLIEDLHWQPNDDHPTTLEMLQRFAETGTLETPFLSPSECRLLQDDIADVEIRKPNDAEIAVLRKRR